MRDSDLIVPGLWQGRRPPEGTYLAERGFTLLILCAREWQPPATDFPGVEVLYAPNDDSPALPLTHEGLAVAMRAARAATAVIQSGGLVLSSCWAGVNRSGLVSALTLHYLTGCSGDEAISLIRRKRRPRMGHAPLSNSQFTEVLRRLPARVMTSSHAPHIPQR